MREGLEYHGRGGRTERCGVTRIRMKQPGMCGELGREQHRHAEVPKRIWRDLSTISKIWRCLKFNSGTRVLCSTYQKWLENMKYRTRELEHRTGQ